MNAEQKAEQISDLLIRAEMTDDERAGWIEAVSMMDKDQLDEFILTFENELREIEALRMKTKEELKPKILEVIRDKY